MFLRIFYFSSASAAVLIFIGIISFVQAQVTITQSQSSSSSSINGNDQEEQSLKTVNDKTTIEVLQGGTIQLTNDPNELKIKYCNPESNCHTYKLEQNGVITLEK
jgi:hypothetical protein